MELKWRSVEVESPGTGIGRGATASIADAAALANAKTYRLREWDARAGTDDPPDREQAFMSEDEFRRYAERKLQLTPQGINDLSRLGRLDGVATFH